jgi:uncharacterized protein (DUF362 family)/Pyruvate/2-oxoacid:ferredoxin oxidoreductase delta subunit
MSTVVAGRCDQYDPDKLRRFLDRAFTEIGLVFDHCSVLLKPNLLAGKPPHKAVNTHPRLVRILGEIFLEKSCDVYVGDSPGYESTERALKNSAILNVVHDLRLKIAPFDKRVVKRSLGVSPYREFLLGEDPGSFDIIVNIPKLKTHAMMGLTLGVKNMFGFVPRFEKAKWHLKAGRDARLFAAILIDIYRLANPTVTILDGVLAMDGDGPSSGRPRELGVIAVSRDAIALDAFIENSLALPQPLPLLALALKEGLVKEAELVDLGMPPIQDFLLPKTMDVGWNLPFAVRHTMKGLFVRKPKCRQDLCKQCGVCMEVCPAGAIKTDEEFPVFDYKKCIRCYCCQELCPESAIHLKVPFIRKVLGKNKNYGKISK